MALLFVNVAMAFVLASSTLAEIRLVQRARDTGNVSFEEARRNDNRQRALGGASTLAFLATGIVWLVFVHRAHSNLDALGARDLRFTHGWAVAGFLVPFLNLVRGPQVMSELLRASEPSGGSNGWRSRPTPPIVPAWWTTYLVGGVVLRISTLGLRNDTASIDDILLSDRILIGTQLLIAISGVLAVVLIRRIAGFQRARATDHGHRPAEPDLA
jgi:hypothetical protein